MCQGFQMRITKYCLLWQDIFSVSKHLRPPKWHFLNGISVLAVPENHMVDTNILSLGIIGKELDGHKC